MYAQDVSILDPITPSRIAFDALHFIEDSVICTDENRLILLFNRAAERAFGYSAAEVIGQPVEMLLPLSDRTKHKFQVQGYLQEGVNVHRIMGGKREVAGRHKNGTEFMTEATVSRHLVGDSTILTVVHRDVTERKRLERQQEVIARELDHRIKNIFSIFSSLVSLTAPGSANVKDYKKALLRRISTLARTQGVLREGAPQTCDLKDVLLDEIACYQTDNGGNIAITGPLVAVCPDAAQTLSLVCHELATNSAKYGALSKETGIVTITYAWAGDEDNQIVIEWREYGGPPVIPPQRQGFGTKLIKQVIQATFGVHVEMEYPQEGFLCRMSLPAAKVTATQKKI